MSPKDRSPEAGFGQQCLQLRPSLPVRGRRPTPPPGPTGVHPSVSVRSLVPVTLGPQTGSCRLSSDPSGR